MEMCDRKYVYGYKSALGSSQNGKTCPKKVNKKKYFVVNSFNVKQF